MSELNRDACRVLKGFDVHACTDVTGFGLMGHLSELARASDVSVDVAASGIEVIEGVRELVEQGIVPGGTKNNLNYVDDLVDWNTENPERIVLCDAQTSGGLLVSLPAAQAERAYEALAEVCPFGVSVVGTVTEPAAKPLRVR